MRPIALSFMMTGVAMLVGCTESVQSTQNMEAKSTAPYSVHMDTQVDQPNVVFIILDDLNDYTGFLGGHPQTHTPHMDALAARSINFVDAHSNVPVCAPSRASLFTGIYAHESKNFGFLKWFENPVLKNSHTMMEYYAQNGYHTLGAGKVMHHRKPSIWKEFGPVPDYGPVWFDGKEGVAHPSVPKPYGDIGKIDGSFAPITAHGTSPENADPYIGWYSQRHKAKVHYKSDEDRSLMPDEVTANWAAKRLGELAERQSQSEEREPFFMAVGFMKPHTPLHVPEKYFKRFDADKIEIPRLKKSDKDDTNYHRVFSEKLKGPRYYRLLGESYTDTEQGLREYIHAYLATVNFVDEQVGKVIEAIGASGLDDNTIIILTSDHGYTLGEKDFLFKNNLWHSGTHVPMLMKIPGVEPQMLDAPVSLIDLYPTLAAVSGLQGDTRKNKSGAQLGGTNLLPYMRGNKGVMPEYALAMIKQEGRSLKPEDHHYALVSKDWRYIRYNDGREELYDRREDPNEFNNLESQPIRAEIKAHMAQALAEKLETIH